MMSARDLVASYQPDTSIRGNSLSFLEDAHEALLDELPDVDYDLIQLGADQLGLVVGGQLRATYQKQAVYASGSTVARLLLEAAAREAILAQRVVRSFNRAVRGSGAVRADVGPKSADWTPSEFVTPESPVIPDTTDTLPTVEVKPEEPFDMPDRARTRVLGADDVPDMPWLESVRGVASDQKPAPEEWW